MQSTYNKVALGVLLLTFSFISCKKLVEVDGPITSVNSKNVYNSDATAAAVLTGIYTNMSSSSFSSGGITSMSLFPALSSDELTLYSGSSDAAYIGYYTNALTNINTSSSDFWINIYPIIFATNSAIEGLTGATSVTPSVKQQLTGEAKFIRAFCYFYLVNLYGDVPLATGTDYTINAVLPRTSLIQVYQQIIADLKDAQNLLSPSYVDASVVNTTNGRVRPNKWAATALLARIYLYTNDWVNAETQASTLIDNVGTYSLVSDLNSVFLANSTEAIWQLQPVNYGQNTQDARLFIIPSTGPSSAYPVCLSGNLLNSFEAGDQRRTNWVESVIVDNTTYYYPYKYKIDTLNAPVTEYEMVLRLGEQYLIRAEARAQQGNISGAQNDLNIIRNRAGLPGTTANTKSILLTAIQHERQVELFTEWGHRWLDLKRIGTMNEVMSVVTPQKGGTWDKNRQLYPIPLSELQHDPNLVQNNGY